MDIDTISADDIHEIITASSGLGYRNTYDMATLLAAALAEVCTLDEDGPELLAEAISMLSTIDLTPLD